MLGPDPFNYTITNKANVSSMAWVFATIKNSPPVVVDQLLYQNWIPGNSDFVYPFKWVGPNGERLYDPDGDPIWIVNNTQLLYDQPHFVGQLELVSFSDPSIKPFVWIYVLVFPENKGVDEF